MTAGEDGIHNHRWNSRAKPVDECDRPEERRSGAFATRFQGGTLCRRRQPG